MADNEEAAVEQPTPKRKRTPFYNTTSMLGLGLALVTLGLMVFLYLLDLFSGQNNPYVGLITFCALPPVMIFGILLYLWGGYRTNKRIKKGITDQHS